MTSTLSYAAAIETNPEESPGVAPGDERHSVTPPTPPGRVRSEEILHPGASAPPGSPRLTRKQLEALAEDRRVRAMLAMGDSVTAIKPEGAIKGLAPCDDFLDNVWVAMERYRHQNPNRIVDMYSWAKSKIEGM